VLTRLVEVIARKALGQHGVSLHNVSLRHGDGPLVS